jgi:hypothetical protein
MYQRAFLRGASRATPKICASILRKEVSATGCGARRGDEAGRLVDSLAGERVLRDALRLGAPLAFLIAFAAAGFLATDLAIDEVPCCFVFSLF